jgi:hypothetical protein
MKTRFLMCLVFAFPAVAASPGDGNLTAEEIVQRSVAANEADWKAAPGYAFTEADAITKGGKTTRQKYEVVMIEGSTYNRLIGVNGEPLGAARVRLEEQKLQREIERRRKESAEARRKRIASYAAERRQDHALMTEMVKAFQYTLLRSETVRGHKCYVLQATPKPGYEPPNRDTKVLTGMRGTLWVDQEGYHWVRVHAEVFRPVAFGLFIAHVQPGTEFDLEDEPLGNGVWLPAHFSTHVKANILRVWSRNSSEDERYSNYRPMSEIHLSKLVAPK